MDTNIIKNLLNNVTLLRFVKRFSANNLLEDNKMAKDKFKISTDENSISILDSSATKMLITNASFEGEVFTTFNMKQLAELIDVVGKEGMLIIPAKSEMREMICKVNGGDLVIVCPLPKSDKKSK